MTPTISGPNRICPNTPATITTAGCPYGKVDAARQREQLIALLDSHPGDLSLDLTQVDEADTSGVQLLLATDRSLRERGHRLHLVQLSSAVEQALRTYGLDASLSPSSTAPAGEPA